MYAHVSLQTGVLLFSGLLLDHPRVGRRILLLLSTSGITLSLFLLGLGFQTSMAWLSVLGLIAFAGFFSVGIGLPFSLSLLSPHSFHENVMPNI
jgi:hypothetical protein